MITILYLLLACLLLWVLIGGKGPWYIKCLFIPLCVWFCVAVAVSLPSMLGWPSKEPLPEKYEVFWAIVENPDLTSGSAGRILVWANDRSEEDVEYGILELYRPNARQPRVHELPYSKQMHEQAQKARELIKKGQRVLGENKGGVKGDGKGSGKGKGNGKGKGREGSGTGQNGTTGGGEENDDSVGPKFYVMPEIELPAKDVE